MLKNEYGDILVGTNVIKGESDGTLLQYSCLENPMDRGAWWAAVHGVARSRTRLSDFTFTFHFHALEKALFILKHDVMELNFFKHVELKFSPYPVHSLLLPQTQSEC